MEFDIVVHHVLVSRFRQLIHLTEPLQRQSRFNDRIGPLRETDLVGHILNFDQLVGIFKCFYHMFSGFKAIFANKIFCGFAQRPIGIEHIDNFEIMLLSDLIVIFIVGRSDFQAPGSILHIHIFICNNRYFALHDRDDGRFTNQILVPFVLRIHTDSRIGQYCFRTCSGNRHKLVAVFNFIPHVIEFRLHLAVDNLFIRKSGLCLGIPVDHALAAVDIAAVVKFNKAIDDRLIKLIFKGKTGAFPVAGSA